MNIRLIASYVRKSFLNFEKTRYKIDLFRNALRLPIIFDLISFILQLCDYKNLIKLDSQIDKNDNKFLDVIEYNKSKTQSKVITTTRRAEILYQILKLYLGKSVRNKQLLIIGPRNIHELYVAWLYGFKWENIQGIDLYSTNTKINIMNMEDIQFDDSSFDCVTSSATLLYAKNLKKALSEVSRILRPNGVVVFGSTYDPNSVDLWKESAKTGNEVHEILNNLSLNIFFWKSNDKVNSRGFRQTAHFIGAIKKDDSEYLDNVNL